MSRAVIHLHSLQAFAFQTIYLNPTLESTWNSGFGPVPEMWSYLSVEVMRLPFGAAYNMTSPAVLLRQTSGFDAANGNPGRSGICRPWESELVGYTFETLK